MDLGQSPQASSISDSNDEELNTASGPSGSLEDKTVVNPEKLDPSNTTATAVSTEHDDGSQTASLDNAVTDTNNDTNEEHLTLTEILQNCPQLVDGKVENLSESAYTPDLLDSADMEANSTMSPIRPLESLPGEHSLLSAVKFTPAVCTTIGIHMEEETFPSLTPVDPRNVPDVYDLDIPSSSPPPSSSPTSGHFRSSSPMPSSPCGYDLTPPTSPVKIFNASTELANIQVDEVKEISCDDIILDRSEIDSEETVNGQDGNVTATVIGEYELTRNSSVSSVQNKDDAHLTDQGNTPQEKVHQRLIPGPKRATLSAQKKRLQKLSKPFRPPAVQKPVAIAITPSGHDSDNAAYKPAAHTSSFAQKVQEKMKHRTAKAAAQFKSPLAATSTGDEAGPLVRPTPTIQALERKLQLLKRAVKVKEESEEEMLSGLIQKWTEAGREIAWEVWGLVKENCDTGNNKRQMEDSWGWHDAGDSKRQKTEERLWGWDVIPIHERQEQCRRTMGSMLVEMGIAAETFGWNAEEERFEE